MLTVFGYGNAARGDDGLGPLLLARLAALELSGLTAIEEYQLQIEHALDLAGADLALFIDAGTGTPAPFVFSETRADPSPTHSSHALPPEAVLQVYARIMHQAPPPSFILCVRGEDFALGADLSPAGRRHLEAAWDFLRRLAARPEADYWRQQSTACRA